MGNGCGPLNDAGFQALVEWQDPQLPRRTVPCDAGLAWQAEHVLGVPWNLPPAWQPWQDTLRWAPVNGNDDLAWSNVQSAQVVVLWQAAQSLPNVPLWRSSPAWHPMHDVGVPTYRPSGWQAAQAGLACPPVRANPVCGVVEGDVLPAGGRVAGGAVTRELPGVRVVHRVAAAAGQADPRPLPVDVAGLAERTRRAVRRGGSASGRGRWWRPPRLRGCGTPRTRCPGGRRGCRRRHGRRRTRSPWPGAPRGSSRP